MFVTVGDQPSLLESVLPPELLRLPEELGRVDALLDDPVFFEPFVPFFDPRTERTYAAEDRQPRQSRSDATRLGTNDRLEEAHAYLDSPRGITKSVDR